MQRLPYLRTRGSQNGMLLCNLLVLFNMGLFLPNLNLENFTESSKTQHHVSGQINSLVIHPEGHRVKTIVAGQSILNCFSPLNRKQMVVGNVTWDPEKAEATPPPVILPFILQEEGKKPDSCFLESYFTQNQIKLHPSCPSGTCVNLNGLSSADAENFVLDSNLSRYCTK